MTRKELKNQVSSITALVQESLASLDDKPDYIAFETFMRAIAAQTRYCTEESRALADSEGADY